MYNDIILIFLCVFAVYGVYSAFCEISTLICKNKRIYAAVRIYSDMDEEEINEALLIAQNNVYSHSFLERAPVIICEEEKAKYLQEYGYDIYVKFAEEK